MEGLGNYMDFEMEVSPARPRPQTFFKPSSLHETSTQPQSQLILSESSHISNVSFDNIMVPAVGELHAMFPQQRVIEPPIWHVNDDVMPPIPGLVQDFPSIRQNNDIFQAQNDLLVNHPLQSKQQSSPSSARKRAPKAPAMSTTKWKPCENRIKQLYVHEGKSIKELREIINEEFGLKATERQYKAQIRQLKLERNVKAREREAIVRHIQHRALAFRKKSSRVRVRGHEISSEKLSRWAKESVVDQPCMVTNPPSPLSSCISLYTNSRCGSPELISISSESQPPGIGSMSPNIIESSFIQKLSKHTQLQKYNLRSQEARAISESYSAMFQLALNFFELFISMKIFKTLFSCSKCFRLTGLVICWRENGGSFHICEKSTLLLERKAAISYRCHSGDKSIHLFLKCRPFYEMESRTVARPGESQSTGNFSIKELDEFVPHFTAILCGYDSGEIFAYLGPDIYGYELEHQTFKLPCQEYYTPLQGNLRFHEDINVDEDEDGYEDGNDYARCYREETELVIENTECGDEHLEDPRGAERPAYNIGPGLEDTSVNHRDDFIAEAYDQTTDPDDIKEGSVEGMDLAFDDSLADDMDITEFFDMGTYQGASP